MPTPTEHAVPHVVIVGGGFGGLKAVRKLRKAAARVTLVDKHNYHLFQPLLYQVATGALSPANIASPLRAIFRRQKNCEVFLAEVTDIDPDSNCLYLADGQLEFDFLILAAGATHSYFGRDEWEKNAPGLKTISDAANIRRRIFLAFEAAERESNPEIRQALMTFVIVGGGPTGVELAGALSEISKHTLKHDFRHINPEEARILIVEAGEHVLRTILRNFADARRTKFVHWESKSTRKQRSRKLQLTMSCCKARQENAAFVAHSGLGKTHLMQGVGRKCCALGYRVRYETSASLIEALNRARAVKALAPKVRRSPWLRSVGSMNSASRSWSGKRCRMH